MQRAVLFGLLSVLCAAPARADDGLRNWFDDPFFQLTSALPDCPEPAGPRVDARERQAQSHRRAEKGTTCWLAREPDCERPSAYAYDADIARRLHAALSQSADLRDSSLWVTVQGRVVYVEGCVQHEAQGQRIEAAIRDLPHVQQAIAIVTTDPAAGVPYRRLPAR